MHGNTSCHICNHVRPSPRPKAYSWCLSVMQGKRASSSLHSTAEYITRSTPDHESDEIQLTKEVQHEEETDLPDHT